MGDRITGDIVEVELSKEKADLLVSLRKLGNISEKRWDRVKEDVSFVDVLGLLYDGYVPRSGGSISCPFHGRDSTPSFNIYPHSNDGCCFGCVEGDKYWDSVKFVSRTLGISKPKALRWLEREFNLPDLPDDPIEEEEDEIITLEFDDVAPEFFKLCRNMIRTVDEVDRLDVARELTTAYFQAKITKDTLGLSRYLGIDVVRRLLSSKDTTRERTDRLG